MVEQSIFLDIYAYNPNKLRCTTHCTQDPMQGCQKAFAYFATAVSYARKMFMKWPQPGGEVISVSAAASIPEVDTPPLFGVIKESPLTKIIKLFLSSLAFK
jgi:hypothetical protein